jgi:L-ascorbate metabolism protein UlaG (beta-lactamase superfamily)
MNKENILRTALTEEQTGLWYLGQEGFVIGQCGHYLAVDPYLSDYVDRNCSGAVIWKRLYDAPIAADELDFLDAVLCTHAHYDHTDPWTLPQIAAANPTTRFVIPAPEVETVLEMGIPRDRIIPAYADRPIELGNFRVTPIPSAHEVLHPDQNGDYHELGYLIDSDTTRIFHAGDMCMYDGLIARLTEVDVAILPINGRDYFRTSMDIIGNFDAVEAVTLAKTVRADLLIPVHHDLYQVNRVSPAYFVDVLMKIDPMRKYHIFAPGERYIYAK